MQKKIVITVPAYNESKNLSNTLKEIISVMKETNYNWQLVIVDDGSEDNTFEIANKYGTVLKHKHNKGLAETFKTEMKLCNHLKADIIVHTDSDGQYPAKFIPALINNVIEGNDLVLGSRFIDKNYSGSFIKRLGNIMFAKVFGRLLGYKITDTTTGFRAFTSEVSKLSIINTFSYTQEQLIRASKEGYKIKEIPITTNKTRKSRLFKNSLDYAVKAWINILRIYRDFMPLKFFGIIGLTFFLIGILLGLYITYMIIFNGGPGGIPRVILCMLLLLTGVQIGLFGFLADMNNKS